MNELIVFSHNDLDALGCMLNIEYKWPNIAKRYFHTNYVNINEIVDNIEEYIKSNGNTHILIADVSFGDNKGALRKLYELANVTHIDHHLYEDGFWDEFPNMKVVWDKSKCATLLCNEYLGNTGQNKALDNLSKLIDVYDIWQVDHPAFDFSQNLNSYFWNSNIPTLLKKFLNSGFKLPDDFTEFVESHKTKVEKTLADYEEKKLIQRMRGITFAFVNEWFNEILIPEMRNGQDFVIGINEWNTVRVRISKDAKYTDEQKDKIRLELAGTTTTGHMNAFTYKSEISVFEEAKRVAEAISACGG